MIKITQKEKLRDLILEGITSKELNSKYDYSSITDMSVPSLDTSNCLSMKDMFRVCDNLSEIDPYNFELYDFTNLKNPLFRNKYPEFFI